MTQKLSSHYPHPSLYQSFVDACRSIKQIKTKTQFNQAERSLKFESLEERCVLSASGLDVATVSQTSTEPETGYIASEFGTVNNGTQYIVSEYEESTISQVIVSVNGEIQNLNPTENVLNLVAGDKLEIFEISIKSNETKGVLAVEAYVSKLNDLASASLVDYNDGRFSARQDNFVADGADGLIPGLVGEWVVENGWDRLTFNLMQYTENSIDVSDRLFIQLNVGETDFAFDEAAFDELSNSVVKVGQVFDIPAVWYNRDAGQKHSYAEVDVYNANNPDEIVWAGALVGNPSGDNVIDGLFVNNQENSPFSQYWTPSEQGEYILKFYIDPESAVAESNESNNDFEVRLSAVENQAPVATADNFEVAANENLDRLDLLNNDLDPDGDDIRIDELTQPDSGQVVLNTDGTVRYVPNEGFSGADTFEYSITDGEFRSGSVAVSIDVQPSGFAVNPISVTDEDKAAALEVDLDTEQFDGVRISGVPTGAELSHGVELSEGAFYVAQSDLNKLSIRPAQHSDEDFVLSVTPTLQDLVYSDLSQTINVQINAVVDGGKVDIQSFGIVTGNVGRFPLRYQFDDLDGSERQQVILHDVPNFISFTTGQSDGNDWILNIEDLDSVQIIADRVADTSDWNSYYYHKYKAFDVTFTVESYETSNGDQFSKTSKFTFYAFQRQS